MHNVEQFFMHLAARVGGEIVHVVDALEIGMTLGIPNKVVLLLVAELTARGWIEILPRSPFGRLHIRLTHQGRQQWEGGESGRG